ncbi:MAG: hypothetical protein WC297_01605 [Candidatus Paceibacterota bacterium]|jgi:hypothetical protein
MPTVNIFYKDSKQEPTLQSLVGGLKDYVAKELTCGDIKLELNEVSVRFIKVTGGEMISAVEIEITAHFFAERVKKQDEICLRIMDYIHKEKPSLGKVKVWLQLSELGHSWKE